MSRLAMFLVIIFTSLRVLAQLSGTTTLAYDNDYDDADFPLNSVACSNGPNGLESKNSDYTTLGSLPAFPNLGGAFTVGEWDSPECGTCYAVTYGNTTVNVLAVDVCAEGFLVSQGAMDTLTGYQAYDLGRVTVSYLQVEPSACGM